MKLVDVVPTVWLTPLLIPIFAANVFATQPACVGDCDGSGGVTVDEIVTMVNIALGGAAASTCIAGDANGSSSITVDEIITALNNALGGCGAGATATPVSSDTPTTPTAAATATRTETPTSGPTEDQTEGPTETEVPEATETETAAPTVTGGMIPPTATTATTPGVTPTETPMTTATAEPEVTDTPESEPSDTPISIPTFTQILVPTATEMAMATHTPGGSDSPAIDVGNASGAPGSTVAIQVRLTGSNGEIAASSNDIVYDTTLVNVVQNGGVACTINPTIGQGSAFAKMLLLNVIPQGGTLARLRIGLISFSSALAVPDGTLFTCQFEIAANAPAGTIVLENNPEASDEFGNEVTVGGSNGLITVQ